MTMRGLHACSVVLGLALIGFMGSPALVAQASSDSAGRPSATDMEKRVADLEKELAGLRGELAALKERKAEVVPAAATLAQSAVASSSPSANDPLSGISSVIGGATVTGLVDAFYAYNVNQPASRTSGLRLFDSSTNQFALNLIELGLVKTPDANSRLGYNLTFAFGNAINVVNSGEPGFAQYLKEGYLSYLAPVGKGLQVDIGKFVTPHGAEVIESHANWNYSRGLLFNYAIPFYHFGLRAKYTFNDKYSLTGYVVNGWNNILDNYSNGKTGGLSFAYSPTKKITIIENWMGGPGALPIDADSWRNLSDTVITYSPTSKLSLMVNGDYGRVEKFNGVAKPTEWWGAAGYVKYQVNPKWAFASRYEYYNDPDGITTGSVVDGVFVPARGHIQEVTGTVERRFAQHLITRLEFRHDMATQPLFTKGVTPVLGQSTVAAGVMFVLEPPR